jgi:arginine/serine-rich coiled-coil protein 2
MLKTEELTGVKVPSFYNTTAINPLVYAEQQKKRKLLWSKAKDNENVNFLFLNF